MPAAAAALAVSTAERASRAGSGCGATLPEENRWFTDRAWPAPRHSGAHLAPMEAKRWVTVLLNHPQRGDGGLTWWGQSFPHWLWRYLPRRGPLQRGRARPPCGNRKRSCGDSLSSPIVAATPRRWWPACGNAAIKRTPPWRGCSASQNSWSSGGPAAGRCVAEPRKRPAGAPSSRLCGSVVRMVSIRSCCGRSGSRCCRALISDRA